MLSSGYRPVPFWSWNDQMNEKELVRQIDEMHKQGFGGFFMHSRIGLVTTYLSERWFSLVEVCIRRAEELGMDVWLYDEDRWPSGYGGGRVPKLNPDFRERMLACVSSAERKDTDRVVCCYCNGDQDYEIVERFADWENPYFNGTSYVDTFNPEATQAFLCSTHEEYKKRFRKYFGGVVKGVFCDEPCYGMYTFYRSPAIPYSPVLRKKYMQAYDEDILNHAEELFFRTGNWRETRWKYYTLANHAFCGGFFEPYSKWCRENGLLLTGHVMAEEELYEQLRWTGGAMPCYEYFDIPGVDKLFREFRQWVSMKQVSSVAAQLGKTRVLSECFAGIGNECGFLLRKQIADTQAILGINFINPHLAAYSIRGARKRDYPPTLFYQQPYWPLENAFSSYLEDLGKRFAESEDDAELLVLHPIGTARMLYSPLDGGKELESANLALEELTRLLVRCGISFHFGDETLLKKYGKAENGLLYLGKCRYKALLLPDIECLSSCTYKLLHSFSLSGGKILFVDRLPSYLEGKFFRFDLPVSKWNTGEFAPKIFDEIPEQLLFCVRRNEAGRVCFAVNLSEQDLKVSLIGGETLKLPPYGSTWLQECEGKFTEIGVRKKSQKTKRFRVIDPKRAIRLNENAVVLDRATYWVNGELVLRDEPVAEIWYRHFYNLPENTPFAMEYTFSCAETLPEDITIILENAENLDEIFLDGKPLHAMRTKGEYQVLDEKAYKDVSFSKVLGGRVAKGKHILRIEGRKINNINGLCTHESVDWRGYAATEAENAYIIGNFDVSKENHTLSCSLPLQDAKDIQKNAPFYAGAVRISIGGYFRKGQKLILTGVFAGAQLYIGGELVDKTIFPPYQLQFDRDCMEAEIDIFNTLFPLIGPHHIKDYEKRLWIDPGLFYDLNQLEKSTRVFRFSLDKIILGE